MRLRLPCFSRKKATVKVEEEPPLKQYESAKGKVVMPVLELAERHKGVKRLMEIYQYRVSVLPGTRDLAGSAFPKSVVDEGNRMCSPWQDELEDSEAFIAGYKMDSMALKLPRPPTKYTPSGHVLYFNKMHAAFKEYNNLLIGIIVETAASTEILPSKPHNPRWHGPTFTMEPTPASDITDGLSISTVVQSVNSSTVYSEPDRVPALLCYQKEEMFDNGESTIGCKMDSILAALRYELCAQMGARKSQDQELLTHQGVLLSGSRAVVTLIDVADRRDVFKDHKMSFGSTAYVLPEERAAFVHDVVKLLQSHESHFEVYKTVIYGEEYDEESKCMEEADPDGVGKIGPRLPNCTSRM